jgi:hypothetical protein
MALQPKTRAKPQTPYRKNGIARAMVSEAVLAWLLEDRLRGMADADCASARTALAAAVEGKTTELLDLAHAADPRERQNAQSAHDDAPRILNDLLDAAAPKDAALAPPAAPHE